MDTRKFIEENLRPSAKDVIESFQEALKIVGIKDLVYSEVKDFPYILVLNKLAFMKDLIVYQMIINLI